MQRRDLLKLLASSPVWFSALPSWGAGAPRWDRIVLLIELKGANDSLNTFIPYNDPLYYEYRPKLAIPKADIVRLDDKIGLHPAFKTLQPLWEQKQLALIHGTGYANPNLSHYRSIEIWNTGSDSSTILHDGWITRLLVRNPLPHTYSANGISLTEDMGPLDGIRTRSIVMNNPQQFMARARKQEVEQTPTDNPALAHILEVQKTIAEASSNMFEKMLDENFMSSSPFKSNLDAQFAVVSHLIENEVANPVYKLSHGSFDTHTNQPLQHDRLLRQLADAILSFRERMQKANLWDRVLIVTYSEFGRRVRENSNLGTDHGTAATQMVIGDAVAGGHYGAIPSLADLAEDNLKYTTDYRSIYSTLIEHWWNIHPSGNLFAEQGSLAFLKGGAPVQTPPQTKPPEKEPELFPNIPIDDATRA